jgi:hypothetical protein
MSQRLGPVFEPDISFESNMSESHPPTLNAMWAYSRRFLISLLCQSTFLVISSYQTRFSSAKILVHESAPHHLAVLIHLN